MKFFRERAERIRRIGKPVDEQCAADRMFGVRYKRAIPVVRQNPLRIAHRIDLVAREPSDDFRRPIVLDQCVEFREDPVFLFEVVGERVTGLCIAGAEFRFRRGRVPALKPGQRLGESRPREHDGPHDREEYGERQAEREVAKETASHGNRLHDVYMLPVSRRVWVVGR